MEQNSFHALSQAFSRHRIASKIEKFSEQTLTFCLPYTHQALSVYLDKDHHSTHTKIETLGKIVNELETLIKTDNEKLSQAYWIIALSELACCREDLVALAQEAQNPHHTHTVYCSCEIPRSSPSRISLRFEGNQRRLC